MNILEQKKHRRTERGFTLLETLVAIAILALSLSGPIAVATQGLASAFFAKDQITAFYLAQEAVEYVRSIRDENMLVYFANGGGGGGGPTPPSSGLVGHWALDEPSGNAIDSSASGNDGIPTNVTQGVSGQIGNAAGFNGTDSQINLGDVVDIGTGDFSISGWFNLDSGDTGRVIAKTEGWIGYSVRTQGDRLVCRLKYQSSFDLQLYTPSGSINSGVWNHFTCVMDRDGNMTIYINGAQSTTGSISAANGDDVSNSLNLYIGRRNQTDTSSFFDGDIDDIRLYNRVLTSQEVQDIYDNGVGGGGGGGGGNPDWILGLEDCIDQNCVVDVTVPSLTACTDIDPSGDCPTLDFNTVSQLYNQQGVANPNNITTPFRREVFIEEVNDDEVSVTVTVYWTLGIRDRTFQIRENLFNWLP